MVRVHASKEHLKKKKKHRRTGSVMNQREMSNSKSTQKNMRTTRSQEDIPVQKHNQYDYEIDDTG